MTESHRFQKPTLARWETLQKPQMVAKGQQGTSALGFTISLKSENTHISLGRPQAVRTLVGFYFLLLGKTAGSKLSRTNIHLLHNLMSFCSLAAPCTLGMKPSWVISSRAVAKGPTPR